MATRRNQPGGRRVLPADAWLAQVRAYRDEVREADQSVEADANSTNIIDVDNNAEEARAMANSVVRPTGWWQMRNRRWIQFSQMTEQHLRNVQNLVMDQMRGRTGGAIIEEIRLEFQRRQQAMTGRTEVLEALETIRGRINQAQIEEARRTAQERLREHVIRQRQGSWGGFGVGRQDAPPLRGGIARSTPDPVEPSPNPPQAGGAQEWRNAMWEGTVMEDIALTPLQAEEPTPPMPELPRRIKD